MFWKPLARLLAAVLVAAAVFYPRIGHAQGAAVTTLHSFTSVGDDDGAQPITPLTPAADGSFYGVTEFGGAYSPRTGGAGTIFHVTAAGALTILDSFNGDDGTRPSGGLALGTDGNFYGTAYGGGFGKGTVFQVTPAGVLTVLHEFDGDGEGSFPVGSLVRGSNGNFYGTTFYTTGYTQGNGTVFTVTPAGALTNLHTFNGNDGADPVGGLVAAGDGFFYGVTEFGGGFGNGTIFKIGPGGALTLLYSFDTDGAAPAAPLVQSSDGDFYGTTSAGGTSQAGVVFRFTPAGALTVLHTFTGGADGKAPMGALLQAADGNFYGTTSLGGANGLGTVFRLTPTGTLTTLYAFTGGANGASPQAALVQAASGSLYGTASGVGDSDFGTVFRVTLAPVLTPASASGLTGKAFAYQLAATNSPYAYTAAGLPPGLALDPATGVISGTPTQVGTFTVNVTATNLGGTASAVLTIAITAPPADITGIDILSPPTNINIVQGETVALEVSVDAMPGTLVKVVLDVYNAPGTAASDTVLGTSNVGRTSAPWTPTVVGNYYLRATATDVTGAAPYFQIPIHVITSPSQPPTSELLSNIDGRTFAANSTLPLVALATDASGNALSNVKFYANGTPLPAPAADPVTGVHRQDASGTPFAQSLFNLANLIGDVLVTVVGTDGNGVTSVSRGANIHVAAATSNGLSCSIDPLAITGPLPPLTDTTATVAASNPASAVSKVEFFVNAESMGTATAAPFAFTFSLPNAGQYALSAIATDAQGTSQSSAPLLVAAALPVVTATPVGNGQAVEGRKNGKVLVQRTGDPGAALTVHYKVRGSAVAGTDYKPVSGVVIFAPGAAQAKIKIKPIANGTAQPTRTAKVKLLSSPDNTYDLGSPIAAKIEIIDGD